MISISAPNATRSTDERENNSARRTSRRIAGSIHQAQMYSRARPAVIDSATMINALFSLVLYAQATPAIDLAKMRVVDLSYSYDEKTLYWPTSPSTFEHKRLHHGMTEGGFFYSSAAFCTPEHGGTHLDAPIHFAEG